MKIKLIIGKGSVIPDEIHNIDCPNEYGGIGNIYITTKGEGFWTGETFIHGHNLHFHFKNVKEVQTRSNLYESSEKWKTIWKAKNTFSYEQYEEAANIIRNIIQYKYEKRIK